MGKISRRKFTEQSAKGIIAAILTLKFGKIWSANNENIWEQITDYARWSPSVHNLQPNRLKIINNNEAILYYDSRRLLPIGDPNGVFTTVALGIFIEYLSVAASKFSKKVEIVEIINEVKMKNDSVIVPFAKLQLTDTDEKKIFDSELIKKRRTSRLHYQRKPLPDKVYERVNSIASEHDYIFCHSSEEKLVDYILKKNQETLFDDLNYDATRNELDNLFRYSKKEAAEKKDGLWAKCMCFPGGLMKSVFQHHKKWTHGIRKKILGKDYLHSFKGTTNIGWFVGKFGNTNDRLNAGRMLAKNWLVLTENNIYLQPFGSLITNEKAYTEICEKLNTPHGEKRLWMLFRAGYSHEPTRSYRLDLKEILI